MDDKVGGCVSGVDGLQLDVEPLRRLGRMVTELSEQFKQLRILQDACSELCAVPRALILENVVCDRSRSVEHEGEANVFYGKYGGRDMVVRLSLSSKKDSKTVEGRKIIQRFHSESVHHSLLQHSNIAPFLGIYYEEPDSPPAIITEYLASSTLENLLSHQKLRSEQFERIGSPFGLPIFTGSTQSLGLAAAANYLHSRKPIVVHGDLHPADVLVDKSGNPKICDFGLAPEILVQSGNSTKFPRFEFELRRCNCTNPSSDIFSLSMIFFNIWTGEKPLNDMDDIEVKEDYLDNRRPQQPRPPPALLSVDAGTEFWELLTSMWVQGPETRISASQVLERLRIIIPQHASGVFSEHLEQSRPPRISCPTTGSDRQGGRQEVGTAAVQDFAAPSSEEEKIAQIDQLCDDLNNLSPGSPSDAAALGTVQDTSSHEGRISSDPMPNDVVSGQ
ncbi:kinase-like protein [Clavulina sp. PMI_390]|nr:kinase-like protein [Clavulina sp. PMI_390]